MIFWIAIAVLAVILLVFIVVSVLGSDSRYGARRWDRLKARLAGALVGLGWGTLVVATAAAGLSIAFMITAGVNFHNAAPKLTSTSKSELVALANSSTTEGRFYFLGSGYINGSQSFSYIVDHGDYTTLNQVSADTAQVYEDTNAHPYLQERHYDFYLDWLLPGSLSSNTYYDFHIPDGSVQSGYNVAP